MVGFEGIDTYLKSVGEFVVKTDLPLKIKNEFL